MTAAAQALSFAVGPVAVELELDEALFAAAPSGWRAANRSESSRARARVRLVAMEAAPRLSDAHGFRDSRFCGGGCRLVRTRLGPDEERIDGESVADPLALARAVRFATQPLLASQGWLLLHAASVVIRERAELFVAASGTGKSTLARALSRAGAQLLGDEVAAVGPEGVAVHPGQSPHGALGQVVPLGTVHLLARGEPGSAPVGGAEATAELLSQAMVYEDGRAAIERALALVSRLVARATIVRTRVPLGDRALLPFGFGAGQ